MSKQCVATDFDRIHDIISEASLVYRGVIMIAGIVIITF